MPHYKPGTALSARQIVSFLPQAAALFQDSAEADKPLLPLPQAEQDKPPVTADSRQADAQTLFVAIRGAKKDGHAYLHSAYAAGCRTFLVETPCKPDLPADAAVWISDNTRRDYSLLLCTLWGNPSQAMQTVGITGTKGKTTVARLIAHALEKHGVSVGYIGTSGITFAGRTERTYNTTPAPEQLYRILFAMRQCGVQIIVMEVSSQALWQCRTDGIRFSVAALTNLAFDHIGAPEHPDFAHYMACKKRLLTEGGAHTVIVNADDARTPEMVQGVHCPIFSFGLQASAHLCAQNIRTEPLIPGQAGLPKTVFTCKDASTEQAFPVTLSLPGEHNVRNVLCALAVLQSLGYPMKDMAPYFADASVPGRLESIPHPAGATVVIDYAHNGASMQAVLQTLRTFAPKHLYCLFGSVGGRTSCRRTELGEAADSFADFTYLTADNPDTEDIGAICREIAASFLPAEPPHYCVIPDRRVAVQTALSRLEEGDILLLAGKGDETDQYIDGKHIPYSDRSVVEEWIGHSI